MMHMEEQNDQGIRVEKDLKKLTRALTSENLDADLMFAPGRGIRACTPEIGTTSKSSISVSERLKRVRPPRE